MDKKHILVYGMTNNPGGIETYLLNLAKVGSRQNIILDFITDFSDIAYRDELEEMGSSIYLIPAKGRHLVKHWYGWFRIMVDHPEYSIVYYNLLDAGGIFSIIIPFLLGRKIIVHSHNGDTEKKTLHNFCRPVLIHLSKDYFACSKIAAEYMFGSKNIDKTVIIPNAIDVKKFQFNPERRTELRKKWNLKNCTVIIHIGRISYQKNPYRVIDIFDELYQRDPSACLLYIGTGELSAEVHAYASQKNSFSHIYFWGVRKDIPDLLLVSDVFLLPSFFEGLPIVAIEAQASGIPCILSDTITDEVKLNSNVHFVSLNDKDSKWVDTILSSCDTPRLSDQKNITEHGYDLNNLDEHYQKIIQKF